MKGKEIQTVPQTKEQQKISEEQWGLAVIAILKDYPRLRRIVEESTDDVTGLYPQVFYDVSTGGGESKDPTGNAVLIREEAGETKKELLDDAKLVIKAIDDAKKMVPIYAWRALEEKYIIFPKYQTWFAQHRLNERESVDQRILALRNYESFLIGFIRRRAGERILRKYIFKRKEGWLS